MLAILTTHPIQYQVPLWQALARDGQMPFEVWYLTDHAARMSRDREFGKSFAWDLDMLSGYPHRFLEVAPGGSPNSFWKCRFNEDFSERLRTSGVKALWVQGWQVAAYWQAVWAAKKLGVEVWLRGESNDLAPVPLWKRSIKRFLLGQFFHRVDHFLCIGAANRRLYENFGVPKHRMHAAPYAVDNERFAQQADALRGQRSEIRKQWGIPEDAFCVLFCGKFIPKKRPLDLVRAAKLLMNDKRLPNVHLLFTGSGELGDQLRSACQVIFDAEAPHSAASPLRLDRGEGQGEVSKSLLTSAPRSDLRPLTSGTKPAASFPGFLNQTEISKAYVAADCLVLSSDYGETWGLVVNEAMASGLPCVISDRCGCAMDLGARGINSVFSCGNVKELSERVLKTANAGDPSGAMAIDVPTFAQTVCAVRSIYGADAADRQGLQAAILSEKGV